MRKRIGIDARLINQTGVGTYIRNLLFYLQKIVPENINFYIYLMPEDIGKIKFENPLFIKRQTNCRWHSLDEQINLNKQLHSDNLDLMHFTYFSYPVLYKRPFIATVHDLTPLLYKTGKASTKNPIVYSIKYRFFKYVLGSQIKNALRIITPTKTVRKQVVKSFITVNENKIIPIYEGVDRKLTEAKENTLLKKKFKDKFFIYVGNFYPHKNIETLLLAYTKVQTEIKLILIGPEDFFAKKIKKIVYNLGLDRNIIFFQNAKKEDLKFFYKNALALLHPSLSEGFGLPVLEAQYFNCPVIASNIEVFKEITQGNYLSFDPQNVEDIKKTIIDFLRIRKRAKPSVKINPNFSFAKMTEQILKIYLTFPN